ncbi:SH3 domain-containing protein [Mesorhizobium marinum]|uniref:SH3 domain-containing protein n=1 Tax=Mesorhizobium marinum TaxID=3228790 RepID=UPI0034669FBB
MALALPKLRWLLIGAVAAGVWVLREDMKGPRPPETVPASRSERSAAAKPKPATSAQPKRSNVEAAKPVPPEPVGARHADRKVAAARVEPKPPTLVLPQTVARPPEKPQDFVTASIGRPGKPVFVQTTGKVHMRAQARPDAVVITTLAPRTVLREVAQSGPWRLVVGDGRKGWVHVDYLAKPPFAPRRPKLPLEGISATKASAGAKPAT